jgi:hypothetical protein
MLAYSDRNFVRAGSSVRARVKALSTFVPNTRSNDSGVLSFSSLSSITPAPWITPAIPPGDACSSVISAPNAAASRTSTCRYSTADPAARIASRLPRISRSFTSRRNSASTAAGFAPGVRFMSAALISAGVVKLTVSASSSAGAGELPTSTNRDR